MFWFHSISIGGKCREGVLQLNIFDPKLIAGLSHLSTKAFVNFEKGKYRRLRPLSIEIMYQRTKCVCLPFCIHLSQPPTPITPQQTYLFMRLPQHTGICSI